MWVPHVAPGHLPGRVLGARGGQCRRAGDGVAVLAAAQPPFTMCFRVKFYPTDPAALKEEITR